VAGAKTTGKLATSAAGKSSKQWDERRSKIASSLPQNKQSDASKQLASNMSKRDQSRLSPDAHKNSGKTPGKTGGFDKSKAPTGDVARKNREDRLNQLKGDKRTSDLASKKNPLLTGKDHADLNKVRNDPNAPKGLKDAANAAARDDAKIKKALGAGAGITSTTNINNTNIDNSTNITNITNNTNITNITDNSVNINNTNITRINVGNTFVTGGVNVTPVDFGGIFGGISTIVSVAVGGGGGGGIFLPPPFVDDGIAIFDPIVPPTTIVDARNFGGFRGVYYGIDDPVDTYATDVVLPPAGPAVVGTPGQTGGPPPEDISYTEEASGPTSIVFRSRYLLIGNSSKEKVTVHVQYLTQDENENWVWLPGVPENAQASAGCDLGAARLCNLADSAEGAESPLAVTFELEPDQYGYAFDGEWQIHACRVRIWAESESGQKWETHKDADFLLVPETDEEGMPTYVAPEMGTVKWIVK
jgi:hypothetical protein